MGVCCQVEARSATGQNIPCIHLNPQRYKSYSKVSRKGKNRLVSMSDGNSSAATISHPTKNAAENDQQCCLGVLYFSQSLHEQARNPVCAGLRRKVNVPHMDELGQADAVPAGDFKYFCVGMSLWDGERMKRNSKEALNPTDPVELPYCEGLEVISASQLQQNPVVLANSAGAPSTSEPSREPQPKSQPQYFPGASGMAGSVDWNAFPGKFQQSAKKILVKMQSNAYLIGDNMKRTVEELLGRNR